MLSPFVDGEGKAQFQRASNGLNPPWSPVQSVSHLTQLIPVPLGMGAEIGGGGAGGVACIIRTHLPALFPPCPRSFRGPGAPVLM